MEALRKNRRSCPCSVCRKTIHLLIITDIGWIIGIQDILYFGIRVFKRMLSHFPFIKNSWKKIKKNSFSKLAGRLSNRLLVFSRLFPTGVLGTPNYNIYSWDDSLIRKQWIQSQFMLNRGRESKADVRNASCIQKTVTR